MSQHKQNFKKTLRSAVANKKLADAMIAAIKDSQVGFNAAMDKLDADSSNSLPAVAAELTIQDVTFVAVTAGTAGNSITVEYIDGGIGGLSVSQVLNAIVVDFGGSTPDATTLVAAMGPATLVSAIVSGTGTDIQTAPVAQDNLIGGAAAVGGMDVNYVSSLKISAVDFDANIPSSNVNRTYRQVMIASLAHKKLANLLADKLMNIQANYNLLLAKLDAEAGTLNDVNYEALLSIVSVDLDAVSHEQNKTAYRKVLRSVLHHKKLADEIVDALESLIANMNLALAQLDSDAGIGALLGNYAPLKVNVISWE